MKASASQMLLLWVLLFNGSTNVSAAHSHFGWRPYRHHSHHRSQVASSLYRRGGASTASPTVAVETSQTENGSPPLSRLKEDSDNDNTKNEDKTNSTKTSESSSPPIPAWQQQLPPPLQSKGNKTLQKLVLGGAEIYLLGTAHVSNDSSADVRMLLEAVSPDCIFVELCEARIALLEGDDDDNDNDESGEAKNDDSVTNQTLHVNQTNNKTQQDFWDRLDSIRQSQGGSRLQALSTLLLTSVQEDYAETLGVELGGEFKAAHRYWKDRHANHTATSLNHKQLKQPPPLPPSLVLGDRPLSLTLVRAWESLWWWPKAKVVAGLLWSSWRKPDPDEIRAWLESVLREETDVLTESLQELRQHFPSLYETIIAERDAWLAAKLAQTCRVLTQQYQLQVQQQQQQQHSKTSTPVRRKQLVAIVGAGHVPGIVQWLTHQQASSPPEAILRNLTTTKRWDKDETVQTEMVPMWTHEVTQVQHNPDWSWAEPSTPPVPP